MMMTNRWDSGNGRKKITVKVSGHAFLALESP